MRELAPPDDGRQPLYALGIADASTILPGGVGPFAGQAITANALLLRWTRTGDVNLDGSVNFADLLMLAKNYGGTGKA